MSDPASQGYTVTLELPDCATDWEADGEGVPTPIDAVESFQALLRGSPDLWVYRVKDNATGKAYLVDMADGPSVVDADDYIAIDLGGLRELGWGVFRHGHGLQAFGDGYMTEPIARARAAVLNAGLPATTVANI